MFKIILKVYDWYTKFMLIKLSFIATTILFLLFLAFSLVASSKLDEWRQWLPSDGIDNIPESCYVAVIGSPYFVPFHLVGEQKIQQIRSPEEIIRAESRRVHWKAERDNSRFIVHYYYGWLRSSVLRYNIDDNGTLKPLSCKQSGGLFSWAFCAIILAIFVYLPIKITIKFLMKIFTPKRKPHPKDMQEKTPK